MQATLERTEASLQSELGIWFAALLDELLGKPETVQKAVPGEILFLLDNMPWWSSWSARLAEVLANGSLMAARQGGVSAGRQLGIKLSWDFLQPAALAWAEQNAATLVKNLGEDIRARLRETIQNGLAGQQSLYEIRASIQAMQDDENQAIFPEWRAGTIARTEVIRAHSQGAVLGYKESGVVKGQRWLDGQSGACPKCKGLHNMVIPLGGKFYIDPQFGDGLPPRHPHCRCGIAPVLEQVDAI